MPTIFFQHFPGLINLKDNFSKKKIFLYDFEPLGCMLDEISEWFTDQELRVDDEILFEAEFQEQKKQQLQKEAEEKERKRLLFDQQQMEIEDDLSKQFNELERVLAQQEREEELEEEQKNLQETDEKFEKPARNSFLFFSKIDLSSKQQPKNWLTGDGLNNLDEQVEEYERLIEERKKQLALDELEAAKILLQEKEEI